MDLARLEELARAKAGKAQRAAEKKSEAIRKRAAKKLAAEERRLHELGLQTEAE